MYRRSDRGRLSYLDFFPTGGIGAGVGKTVAIDPLGSQNSLIMSEDGKYLYAVNAGNDTITVFQVFENYLKFLDIVPSGGRFPVSLTVHRQILYVLNAGAMDDQDQVGIGTPANITGFRLTGYRLIPLEDSTRELVAVPQNPNDPGSDFPNILATPAQVQFSPRAEQLVVTVKDGVSALNNSIWVFPVEKDKDFLPADTPFIFPTAGPVPFGFTFDSSGRLIVTDAGAGTVTPYKVGDDSVEMIGKAPAETGQAATCWIIGTRPFVRYVYTANTGSGTLSGYRVKFDGTLSPVGLFPVKEGALNIDLAISRDGKYMYTQNGGLGTVSIFRVNQNGTLKLIDEVEITEPVSGFQGIVAW
jgi:6-phosphogluconolactonase